MPTIIALLAFLAAVVAISAALRIARRERARSAARVTALANAIDPPAADDFDMCPSEDERAAPAAKPAMTIGLGAATVSAAMVLAIGGAYVTTSLLGRPPAAAVRQESTAPLTLVSMRHARQGETLTVTGLVRNDAGRRTEPLVAVVLAFDKAGDFVASARAPIDLSTLSPGDESPFRVAVPHVPDVARYRVSFRTGAGAVPHLDRRAVAPRSAGGLPGRVAS